MAQKNLKALKPKNLSHSLQGRFGNWHRECSNDPHHPNRYSQKERNLMNSQKQDATKGNEALSADLTHLVSLVANLPTEHRGEIEEVLGRVVESTKRRRRILTLVQEALSQLRLDMKYLVFDLEATRRERDQYKGMVDNQDFDQDKGFDQEFGSDED